MQYSKQSFSILLNNCSNVPMKLLDSILHNKRVVFSEIKHNCTFTISQRICHFFKELALVLRYVMMDVRSENLLKISLTNSSWSSSLASNVLLSVLTHCLKLIVLSGWYLCINSPSRNLFKGPVTGLLLHPCNIQSM